MTKLVATLGLQAPDRDLLTGRDKRLIALLLLTALVAAVPGLTDAALAVAADAYLEIAVFVAATLGLVLFGEKLFKTSIAEILNRHRALQVPVGALLGAFPGCGGAIVAVTQFTRGSMSFGGFVAALITTSGDAMFLLLAAEPATGLLVIAASVAVGIPFGYLLDALHGPAFLRPAAAAILRRTGADTPMKQAPLRLSDKIWLAAMVPMAVIAIPATMADIDLSEALGPWVAVAAVAATLFSLALWVRDGEPGACSEDGCSPSNATTQVLSGTNFVIAWVMFAMVGYEAILLVFDIEIESLLMASAALVPLMAIMVGFIPGCGPQIVVTSLYVSGALPLSAQLGNAIANDGDALFPALAVAPRAAAAATVYSAIPAFALAYTVYFLMENPVFPV